MKACWVVRSKIINKVHYKKYTDLFSDIIKKYNGKNFAHGGNLVLEISDRFIELRLWNFLHLMLEKNVDHQKNIKSFIV